MANEVEMGTSAPMVDVAEAGTAAPEADSVEVFTEIAGVIGKVEVKEVRVVEEVAFVEGLTLISTVAGRPVVGAVGVEL